MNCIDKAAFASCFSLSRVSISNNVEYIGESAFDTCISLKVFNIPKAVRTISAFSFYGCVNLREITMHSLVEVIDDFAFSECKSLKNVVFPVSTIEIGSNAFASCESLENIAFSDNITKIGAYAFYGCTSLPTISLPNGLAKIEQGTFAGCVNLAEVTLPSHLYIIGESAFSGCTRLKTITVPNGVAKIEQRAFSDCSGLRSIEIPESVVAIEEHAFDGCSALTIKAIAGSYAERYAKEHNMYVEYLYNAPHNPQPLGEDILKAIKDLSKDVRDMGESVRTDIRDVGKKVDELHQFVELGLQEWLKEEKIHLDACISVQDIDTAETMIATSVLKSNSYINQQVSSATHLMKDETNRLKIVFGPTWEKLLPYTQTSLISAGVLWSSCSGIEDPSFDYSGICITTTCSLEAELKHYFYTGFQQYMIGKYGNPSQSKDRLQIYNTLNEWPEELLDKKHHTYIKIMDDGDVPEIKLGNQFTMGTLPYLFYSKKSRNLREKMNEYLSTIIKKPESAKGPWWAINMLDYMVNIREGERDINSFVSRCEQVRDVYRNPAAHSGIVSKETALACSATIVGKEAYSTAIVGRTDAFVHNTEVQGLIMKLHELLK